MPLDNSAEYGNHIPDAVRREAARVDEIARAAGIANVRPLEGASGEPFEPEPATPTITEPVEPPVPITEPTAPGVDFEAKYNSLRGKYDAEVPRLQGRIESLERLLSNMQAATAAPAAPAQTTTTVVEVPPEDVAEFGPELVAAARRWARLEMRGELDELRQRLDQMQGHQVQLREETTHERVMSMLDVDQKLAGKWRTVNDDPEFLSWLNETDPFAGVQRLRLLRQAFDQGDHIRVGRFFKTFIAEHTAVNQPPVPPAAAQTPPQEEAGARPTLESLAAPGRSTQSGPEPSGASEKRMWTSNQIARFYNDVRKGVYRGREAEQQRTENDIFDAAREGRVRP